MEKEMYEWVNGWVLGLINGCMENEMYEWVNGWV